jgi:D-alanyl-D-alanine carboxypeptidase (penicillin-binding protein 5/6)
MFRKKLTGVVVIAVGLVGALAAPGGTSPTIQATRAVVADPLTDKVLWSYNADQQTDPWSTTKVMTMAIALEAVAWQAISLNDTFAFSKYALTMPCQCLTDASSNRVTAGEVITVQNAMFSIAISDVEPTVSLAEFVANALNHNTKATGGSNVATSQSLEAEFVQMMNDKAAQWSLQHTHFTNPAGIPNANHYSSARDIVHIMENAVALPSFKTFFGVRNTTITTTTPSNTMRTYPISKGYSYYPNVDADKNGCWGSCPPFSFVAQSTRLGYPLIASVMPSPQAGADVAELFRDGFDGVLRPKKTGDSGVQPGAAKEHALDCLNGKAVTAWRDSVDHLRFGTWTTNIPAGTFTYNNLYATADVVDAVDVAHLRTDAAVTASRTGTTLSLRSWTINANGIASPVSKLGAGTGTRIVVRRLSSDLVASLATTTSGHLELRTWKVDVAGVLTQVDSEYWGSSDPFTDDFAIASRQWFFMVPGGVQGLVASRLSTGKVMLGSFTVDSQTGAITLPSPTLLTGPFSKLAVTATAYGEYATSMVDGSGYLRVSWWTAAQNGAVTFRGDSGVTYQSASETSIAPAGSGDRDGAVTAIKDASGWLRLTAWELDGKGEGAPKSFYKLSSASDSWAQHIDICGGPTAKASGDYITGVQAGGNLKLIAWRVGAKP